MLCQRSPRDLLAALHDSIKDWLKAHLAHCSTPSPKVRRDYLAGSKNTFKICTTMNKNTFFFNTQKHWWY